MPADHADDKYTKPALRRRLKYLIQASSKGGRKGQWSARKSQLLVQAYERQGGGDRNEVKSRRLWPNGNWCQQPPQNENFNPTTATARPIHMHDDPRSLNEEELKRLTKETLVRIARSEELPNRSKMNKAQLARTLRRHFRQPS